MPWTGRIYLFKHIFCVLSIKEVVFCRDLEFPEEYREEINDALHKLKLDVKDLKLVDNSCPPHPEKTPAEQVEGAIEDINPEKVSTEPPPIDTRD